MRFDKWWLENKPDMPVEVYALVKSACRSAWQASQDEERDRCGLIAETYPFSPAIGKGIAGHIYRGGDNE